MVPPTTPNANVPNALLESSLQLLDRSSAGKVLVQRLPTIFMNAETARAPIFVMMLNLLRDNLHHDGDTEHRVCEKCGCRNEGHYSQLPGSNGQPSRKFHEVEAAISLTDICKPPVHSTSSNICKPTVDINHPNVYSVPYPSVSASSPVLVSPVQPSPSAGNRFVPMGMAIPTAIPLPSYQPGMHKRARADCMVVFPERATKSRMSVEM